MSGPVTAPGISSAWGTRLGRPEEVVPAVGGSVSRAAARQPSSAGESQGAGSAPPAAGLRRLNHSDCSSSKIDGRTSMPGGAGGRVPSGPNRLTSRLYWPGRSGSGGSIRVRSGAAGGTGPSRRGRSEPARPARSGSAPNGSVPAGRARSGSAPNGSAPAGRAPGGSATGGGPCGGPPTGGSSGAGSDRTPRSADSGNPFGGSAGAGVAGR